MFILHTLAVEHRITLGGNNGALGNGKKTKTILVVDGTLVILVDCPTPQVDILLCGVVEFDVFRFGIHLVDYSRDVAIFLLLGEFGALGGNTRGCPKSNHRQK